MKPKTAIILIAPPAAGKSTFCLKHKDKVIVSPDLIRERLYGDMDIQGGAEVFTEFYREIDELKKTDKSIILDATHCRLKDLKKSVNYLINDYKVIMVVFLVPLAIHFERNAKRDRHVPEEVISRMWNALRSNLPEIRKLAKDNELFLMVKEEYEETTVTEAKRSPSKGQER